MGWGDILPVTLISLEQWLEALTSDLYSCCWVITACDRWGKRALSVSCYPRTASLTAGWNLSLQTERKGQRAKATLPGACQAPALFRHPVSAFCYPEPLSVNGYGPSLFSARSCILHAWESDLREATCRWGPVATAAWNVSVFIHPSIHLSTRLSVQPSSTKGLLC